LIVALAESISAAFKERFLFTPFKPFAKHNRKISFAALARFTSAPACC
jgi:hypothetical protein